MPDALQGAFTRVGWRTGVAVATLAAIALVALTVPHSASAADRTVRLTLDAPPSACSAFDPLDCAYLSARNGNKPAPDTTVDPPTGAIPTFLNLAQLPSPAVINGVIDSSDNFTANQGSVKFPTYPTTLDNALVGPVSVAININQTGDWSGTFNQTTGDVDIEAPLGLSFKLNCGGSDPAYPLCAGVFGPEGDMGTWRVDTLADPHLITGNSPSTPPPPGYLAGPPPVTDWEPPVVTDGVPYAAGPPETVTLINNTLQVRHIDPSSCIDPSSAACTNPIFGGLVAGALNDAIGTEWSAGPPEAFKDSVKGAIDMNLPFTVSDAPLVESSPNSLDFGEQTRGTSGAAQTVEVTASTAGDLVVRSLYKTGAGRSDFWISDNGCGAVIEAGQTCELDLRFNPSASGVRSAALVMGLVNPINGLTSEVQLATLTGTGTSPAGPEAPKVRPRIKRSIGSGPIRIKANRRSFRIAEVKCMGGTCTIPRVAVRIAVRGKTYRGLARFSRAPFATGTSRNVVVTVPPNVFKRMPRGRKVGAIRATIRARSDNGGLNVRSIAVGIGR